LSDATAPGAVFVVSAPSGAGKTTLCKRLLAEVPALEFSVSFTTRAPRPGEREGVDYHFVGRDEFDRRRRDGEFLEWAMVDGECYGTSGRAVKEATGAGQDILLDIDSQGAEKVRTLIPDAVLIFIMPPGKEALRKRLMKRGTDTPETMARRLSLAWGEILKASLYDYVIINDDLEEAYERLRSIVVASRCRRERQTARIKEISAGFVPDPPGGA
jgi:guanylate kinase